jgi:hypothetical protein
MSLLVDCYTIPLDCYDGMKYLHTLSPILWDFEDLCMAFWHQGRRVLWKGLGSPRTDIATSGRIHSVRGVDPALMDLLLQQFADVFAAPMGLPPPRPCDHRIHFLPGTAPVAVHPYRYSHPRRMNWRPSARPCTSRGSFGCRPLRSRPLCP